MTSYIIDGNVQQIAQVINTLPVVEVGVSGIDTLAGTAITIGLIAEQLTYRNTSNSSKKTLLDYGGTRQQ